jgi:catechol 2,3-dioxygenase-like lactoylglutathione lyase family enzyme
VPARRREEWSIPDPRGLPLDGVRAVRDRIETEVRSLLGRLESGRRDATATAGGGGAMASGAASGEAPAVPGAVGPAVTGVLETCVYASDLAAAERFYAEVIGLTVIGRQPGRHVFFRCGAGVFLVFDPGATADEAPSGAPAKIPPHGARGAGHAAFAVEETALPAWRARLAGLRIAIEAEIAWPGGGASIYVRDPAGNSIELATPRLWAAGGDPA